tara:strand:+ start:422 stop:832 length:411 start_codon:yes stop_codon:yes gene_type:complete
MSKILYSIKMLSCTCTRNTDVDESATKKDGKQTKGKPEIESIEDDLCKCRDLKNEKGEIIGKSCTKKIETDGKIKFEKCCDKEKYNENKDEAGKVKCVKKPPPAPKLKIVQPPEPQSERSLKGKPVKKANIDKKLR